MGVRTRIDPDCPYVPFRAGHSDSCDRRAHVMLALDVAACVDPPLYRAMNGDHSICAMVPCAYCRQSVSIRWFWNR